MQELNPLEWAVRPLKRYADFNGRAPRAEYWWFAFASSVAALVLRIVDARIAEPIFGTYGPLRLVLTVALLIPSYAVTVRRLHDTNTTAWWVMVRIAGLPFLLFPLLHLDLASVEQLSGWLIAAVVLLGIAWACAEINLFVFMVTPGISGANSYGADPHGPDELEEVFA